MTQLPAILRDHFSADTIEAILVGVEHFTHNDTTADSFLDAIDAIATHGDLGSSGPRMIEDEEGNFVPVNDTRKRYSCGVCNGTGKFLGVRTAQTKEHCFACRGSGFFYTDEATRKKNRVKASERKKKSVINSLTIFDETFPGMREFLKNAGLSGNAFAASIHAKLLKYGDLTEKQAAAAFRLKADAERSPEEKATERAAWEAANPGVRDFLATIQRPGFMMEMKTKLEKFGTLTEKQSAAVRGEMDRAKAESTAVPTLDKLAAAFLTAAGKLQWPKLRLMTEDGQSVVLTRCGPMSKTPGHINITDGGRFGSNRYFGRLTPDGKVFYKNAPQSVIALLTAFNADPQAEIKVQGLRTGQCCACGRELTDPVSLANGIGPICAEKYGF